MIRMAFATASAAALFALAAPAMAQTAAAPTGAYGTLGGAHVDGDSGVNFETLQGRLGYKFHPNLGVEAEGAIGLDGYNRQIGTTRSHLSFKHSAAAYAVGSVPIGPKLDLFARVGYGTTRIKATAPGVSLADSEESINYGVGGQYFFDGKNGVRADFTRQDFRHDQGKADVYGVSFVRRF